MAMELIRRGDNATMFGRASVVGAVAVAIAGHAAPMHATGATTDQAGFVALAFSNTQSGVVIESRGPADGTSCALSLFATTDAGATWSRGLAIAANSPCIDPGETGPSVSISTTGRWWIATPQVLYWGEIRGHTVSKISAGKVGGAAEGRDLCTVEAVGATLWVTTSARCDIPGSSSSSIERSTDDGVSWQSTPSLPLGEIEGGGVGGQETSALSRGSEGSAVALGTLPHAIRSSSVDVATTMSGGAKWKVGPAPCGPYARMTGLLSEQGSEVAAACLGEPSAGFEKIQIVRSMDAGATWSLECSNGPKGLDPIVGSCPMGGYPGSLVLMGNGIMLMALGYIGGIVRSDDGGRTWRQSLVSESSFPVIAKAFGAVWMLGVGAPSANAVNLAETTDGAHWVTRRLPPLR
jgi:hypothetical protein